MMFFFEFILVFFCICLLSYIVFFLNSSYSFSVLSKSLNNFVQIVLMTLVLTLLFFGNFDISAFSNCFMKDSFGLFFQVILMISFMATVIVTKQFVSTRLSFQQEYELLITLSFVGLLLLCFSSNFLIVYLAIELQSLVFYTLASIQKRSEFSGEAGLKYFVLGSFSSGLLLFGFANIYLFTSAWSFESVQKVSCIFVEQVPSFFWGLLLLSIAFLFKLGVFPFHHWVCDVYEGSFFSVTMLFVLVPKAMIFCVFTKLFFKVFCLHSSFWINCFIFCSFFSIVVGNVSALYQKKLKRLLAFSAVSHAGFLLVSFCCFSSLAVKAFTFYFLTYIAMSIVIFSIAILSFTNQNFLKFLINWSDLAKRNLALIFSFSITLFSTAGIPPLAGFYAKLLVFLALIQQGWIVLTVFITLLSCVGCYFYIRLIKVFFFKNEKPTMIWVIAQAKSTELIVSNFLFCFVLFLLFPDFALFSIDLVCFCF